jgi:phage shock protein C
VNPRRLYRSRSDRAIAGIAGGMAEYLEVDPTIVRILWIFATIFTGGLVLLLYIVLAFVIPINPFGPGVPPAGGWTSGAPSAGWSQASGPAATGYQAGAAPTWSPDWSSQWEARRAARAERPGRGGLIIGSVLIVFGLVALADLVVPGWISGALFVPALLLAIGVALLVASLGRGAGRTTPTMAAGPQPAPTAPAPAAETASDVAAYQSVDAPAADASAPPAPPAGTVPGWETDATTTFPPQPESDRT